MPVTLRVTQYDRGAVLSEFNATASSPKLEAIAATLKGASIFLNKTVLREIGKHPVEIRDDQDRLRFVIEIESITF